MDELDELDELDEIEELEEEEEDDGDSLSDETLIEYLSLNPNERTKALEHHFEEMSECLLDVEFDDY